MKNDGNKINKAKYLEKRKMLLFSARTRSKVSYPWATNNNCMHRMPWVKYVLMPEIRCLLNWKKGNLCRRSPCRSRTQIYYNNTRKLLTVMRILRMFRYTINCAFNSTLMLYFVKEGRKSRVKQLLKRISLMLSAPVQLNNFLHTLAR